MRFDPAEVAAASAVRTMHPQVRAGYFALMRAADSCGVIEEGAARELLAREGARGRGFRASEVLDALAAPRLAVLFEDEITVFTPEQRTGADVFAMSGGEFETWECEVVL